MATRILPTVAAAAAVVVQPATVAVVVGVVALDLTGEQIEASQQGAHGAVRASVAVPVP
eukprot:COSAG05_NODE_19062_length_298_cov_0.783920_1_plen_58_part_01